jgi:uncharacterized protein (DUF1778 family)
MIDEYMKKYPVRFNLRMEEEMQYLIERAAGQLNMSQAQFIRLALQSQLNKSIKTIRDEFHFREF